MKNKISKLWVLFIIFAVVSSSLNGIAIAANNQVNPTGDTPDEILNDKIPNFTASASAILYVPDPYPTIQAAIDNASAGDTIIVRDGTYVENIVVDKSLTIRSENGSDFTVVQAQKPYENVFDVTADYVNLSGFTVREASDSSGIYLRSGTDHCNITDNNASNNYIGINLYYSNNNTIANNTANSNSFDGIRLQSSNGNTISSNNANSNSGSGSGYGIDIMSSSNNIIANNTANSNNYHGISLGYSSNYNTITGNTANSNNQYGINIFSSSNYNTISNNTANSNNWYGILLQYSSNNTIASNTASNNWYGIWLHSSSNNTISNNTADLNRFYNIYLDYSNNNSITDNTADDSYHGIYLVFSNNNTLSNNTANSHIYRGFYLYKSSNNIISSNTANSKNYHGIHLTTSCSNNTISNNTVNANGNYGIYIYYSCNYNTISNNTIKSNNNYGIYLSSSNSNTIYNNYLKNTRNAYDDGNNIWSISKTLGTNIVGGLYLGGNYWSDYKGADTDGDGIGDTMLPYNNGIKNGDWLPLFSSASVEAYIDLKPETLNLGSKGVFTAFITLQETYNIADINIDTVVCQGAYALSGHVADDGKYVAKFDREDITGVVPGLEVELTLTGELFDGTQFEGSDTIRVIGK